LHAAPLSENVQPEAEKVVGHADVPQQQMRRWPTAAASQEAGAAEGEKAQLFRAGEVEVGAAVLIEAHDGCVETS
jgi:hypothetical protein